jgi:hypothetical protein
MDEMYCAIIDDETGKCCERIDKSFMAYCIKHGRSAHKIRQVEDKFIEEKKQ